MESTCKRFRQSAIGENFSLKHETQLKKKPDFNNGDNSTRQYKKVKEKL